ncbi:sulfotransferase [Sphingomicrobium astaxanthinifaciens]|uniref:sulfotransferase n=1 Tax=Sphingomicrobium astaxanthinifaciens TaxID=1227949 RepID=UPI001FCA5360|nr:sulfotransferase [Sphingomicrobium astaxanthinifaciens]MCJ7421784.1 sulfotransferase [Sphingomicrobium astaxanthinifaciens]
MAIEDYGWADRIVHRLAFGSPIPQDLLLDIEQKKHGRAIAAQPLTAPIFVTALARAGTTLILEILARHPRLASHTHRDMPFVLTPILWRELTWRFAVAQEKKERSHKDGLLVNVDSPEAFEEILWKREFPDHYRADGITPWGPLPEAFTAKLSRHMKALVLARGGGPEQRYLSKNNANIARLPGLAQAFPDARFLVPLRHPVDHARSFLRQHRLGLDSHAESDFARRYAADTGHHEFGLVHKPILFDGFDGQGDATRLDYWLRYWIAAYRAVEAAPRAELIDMQRFTAAKKAAQLFAHLGLPLAPEAVAEAEAMIRPIKAYDGTIDADPALVAAAEALYERLRADPRCVL